MLSLTNQQTKAISINGHAKALKPNKMANKQIKASSANTPTIPRLINTAPATIEITANSAPNTSMPAQLKSAIHKGTCHISKALSSKGLTK